MFWRDALRFLRAVTFKKCWNALLVYKGFYQRNPLHPGLPVSLSVEPTTACNLGCPECPSGLKVFSRPTGNLKLEEFKSWVKEWKDFVFHINFYFQGEPFIHPQLIKMIQLAHQARIYTAVSTNAHFMNQKMVSDIIDSGLDRIIISLDGFTQEVYEQYRVNGRVDEVKKAVELLVAEKRKRKVNHPHIIVQTLVVKPNEHEVDEIKAWSKSAGVNEVKWKTAQLYHPSDDHPLMPINEKYRRYRKNAQGQWVIKSELDNHCWRLWSSCVITWDGGIVPCCFDKDAAYKMGSLRKQSLNEIWNNDDYKRFRSQLLSSRKSIDICSNCSEGTKVWV
jgi:radical SAM protein with 4Fe4S-binding SPASM domain